MQLILPFFVPKRNRVDEKITAPGMLHATHPIIVASLRDKIAIRKAWTLARSSMDRENKQAEAGTALEAPLHSRTAFHLQDAWQNYHHFRLSNAMMLIATTVATLYRQLHANPRQLAIFLLQNVRTHACVLPGAKWLLTMSKTGNIEAQGEVADACDRHHDLYIRLQAFFYTVAYVSFGLPGSFTLQSAVDTTELLLQFICNRYDGELAPLSFYLTAWTHTSQRISEGIRAERTLAEVMKETSAWEHHWANWGASGGGRGNHGGNSPDLPKGVAQLQEQVNRLTNEKRPLQSQRDKNAHSKGQGGGKSAGKKKNDRGKNGGGGGAGGGGKRNWPKNLPTPPAHPDGGWSKKSR